MRRLLIVLILAVPAGQACSIAAQDFTWADVGDDIVVTHLNQDGVKIDLSTGKMDVLSQQFFPKISIDDDGRWIGVQSQEGLGADCSGDVTFEVLTTSFSKADVDDHDIGTGHVAVLKGTALDVYTLGTWARFASHTHPMDDSPFGGAPRYVAVADDGRVAATTPDQVIVYGASTQVHDIANVVALDWFGDELVVGVNAAPGASFTILHADGTSSTITIASDNWAPLRIAAGQSLLLSHGPTVLRVDGDTAHRLHAPDGLQVGGLAADDDGAALMVVEETEYGGGAALGIQRLDGAAFGDYHARSGDDWPKASKPAWAWVAGPAVVSSGEGNSGGGSEPGDSEDAPAPAIVGLIAAVGVAFLARRLR